MKKVQWDTLRAFPDGAITAEVQGNGCLAIDYPNQRRIFSVRGKDVLELPVLSAPGDDSRAFHCTSDRLESFYSAGGSLRKGLNGTALVSSLDTTACTALMPYDGGLAVVFKTEVVLVSYSDLSVIERIKVKLTNPECSSYCASSSRLLITDKNKFYLLDTDLKKVVYRGRSPRNENIDNCWAFGDLAVLATKSFVQIIYIGEKLACDLPTQSTSSSVTATDSASNISSSSGISLPLSLPLSSSSDLLWNPVISIIPVPYPVTCSLIVGERLIVGNIIGGVDYYDIESGSHILSRKVREGLGLFVVLSLNCLGDFLIVTTSDGELMLYHLYEKEQEKPFITTTLVPLSCCFFTNNQLYAVDYNCTSLYHWAPNYKLIQQVYAKSRFQVIHKEAPKIFKGKLNAFAEWLFKAKEKPGDLAAFINRVNVCFAQQYPEIGDIYQPCTITNPNLPDNPIMYVNDSFVELTGYAREEIEGVNCRFLQGKFSDTEDVRLLSEKIKTEQPHYAELLNYTKDGKPFWNNFACLPVHDGNKLIAFVAVQNDISMIKLDTDPREWNAVEVALFIAGSGFHFCSPLFISCGVCGKRLFRMKKGDLEALGVPPDYVDDLYRLIKARFLRTTLPKNVTSRSILLTELSTSENSELESVDEFPVLVFDDRKTVSTPRPIAFTQDSEDDNHHEFEIDIRSKNVGNKKNVLIGILPESMSWNQKNFFLLKELHQPLYQTCFAGDKGHLNFIGSKPKKNEKDFPVVVVSVVRKGHKAYFAKQTPLGYQQWSTNISNLVSKSGALDSKQVQKYLVRRFGFDKWKQISNDPLAITKLYMIDDIRSKVLTFGLGVLFRKKGQTTRKEIFSNQLSDQENKRFSRFLSLMEVGDRIVDPTATGPERSSIWREKKIYWNLSPELTKEQQRQYIGNSLAVLIFNDGQDTFDPLELELGSVTCLVGVITPVKEKFRLDFYFHYVVDLAPNSKNYEAPTIPKIEIPPEVPHNYLFDDNTVKDFTLAKIHNGLVVSSVYHPLLKRVTIPPLTRAFEELANLYPL